MGTRTKTPKTPKLMTQKDIADEFGPSRRQILEWAKSGKTGFPEPVRVVERTYLFNRADVAAYFRRKGKTEPAEPGTGS
jgi:hypothetical protein